MQPMQKKKIWRIYSENQKYIILTNDQSKIGFINWKYKAYNTWVLHTIIKCVLGILVILFQSII